ncbi:MAG TPA: nucleotidyltransferase family protein, partial [Actinomycetota bacterium]|nr:nucleotidyltransferase family protein [Actinomycetota bacterium]
MAVSQDQAVILAGGQATRMRPYTDDRPKAMVELGGRPIIEHQIEWLRQHGVSTLVVSCGYRADLLQSHLGDGSSFGVAITYAVEETPLGRGGGLKYAAGHLPYPDLPWFALNGDVIARFDLREMA